ncbi:hypothetical protein [Litoribrevibacter albus]|uniref:Uncharacterized protein n=1 Tax=Litoribrevibacter albus TaxID=1473156 RepID=A0AA37SE50_9GAMM|nr:hypothetical protein [Litoribrevibacter albus]GLQ33380.1 hypothetical protein GCM10007876_38600 [Litoribrevibacter albus]
MKRILILSVLIMNVSGCSALHTLLGPQYSFPDPEEPVWATEQGQRHCKIQPCANYHY